MNDTEYRKTVTAAIVFVKAELSDAEAGHDWSHIERVWKLSRKITQTEKADPLVVELGALLHDIADSKFHNGDETIGPAKARIFLQSRNLNQDQINQVIGIVEHISFKGGNHDQTFSSPELNVVQDADRLDAIGAIGIARTFHYGGYKNRKLYDPDIQSNLKQTKEEYKKNTAPTINHFYEKLLLLKDRMNTVTGKKLANRRHKFMEDFLDEFYKDWEGK